LIDPKQLPGPERKKYLQAVIKCLRRAEFRIARGKKLMYTVSRNTTAYTYALQALKIKRSQLVAELMGLPWEAKPYKPPQMPRPPR